MISYEKAIEVLKALKASAKIVDDYEGDIINDYRYLAESEKRDIIDTLLKLDLEG